jgi:hypothetical protein
MHVPKPAQGTFPEVDVWLPAKKFDQMARTWAEPFQRDVLPLLLREERRFARFYSPDQGAPNKPVAVMLGLHILKEMFDLTDALVVEEFDFNTLWHYALQTPSHQAHVCAKTLYNFRQLLLDNRRLRKLFAALIDAIIREWGIKTSHHRIDSTHILSNMKILRRLGLFVKTIEPFLKRLARLDPKAVEALPKRFRENYLEREGYFADAKSSQARHRLDQCAKDLWYLIDRFRDRPDVTEMNAYPTMVRLFDEQCVVVGEVRDDKGHPCISVTEQAFDETDSEAEAEMPTDAAATQAVETPAAETILEKAGEAVSEPTQSHRSDAAGERIEAAAENVPAVADAPATDPVPTPAVEGQAAPPSKSEMSDALDLPVVLALRKAEDVASDSLQSPSDTDATYSGHKGKGYQAQLAETCHPDNPFQVIDYVQVEGAHESDMNAPGPIHKDLIARGHRPDTSFVDTGYVSGKNIVEAGDDGVQLLGPMSGVEPSGRKLSLVQFEFGNDRRTVTRCPAGHAPLCQGPSRTKGTVNAHFARAHCNGCPLAAACPTKATRHTRRLRFSREDVAIAQRRQEQETAEFKEAYKIRSGEEGTHSRLKNHRGMGRLRVRGQPAVRFVVTFKVIAENCHRAIRHVLQSAQKAAQTLKEAAHGADKAADAAQLAAA